MNESVFIERCLLSLLPQIRAGVDEVLVIDGGSSDDTCDIVLRLQLQHPELRLLHNAKRLQAAAVNLGAKAASPQSKIIVRADAHADYPSNFIELCVSSLIRQGAHSVVVPMQAQGRTALQRAIAWAQNSLIGNGGSSHRRADSVSKFVDHGHHAAFHREVFLLLDGYNEGFTHNEDAEYDYRLRSLGGRIWMCTEACIIYFPRRTWRSLAIQYFNHGRGRGRTLLLHRQTPKLRQIAPVLALAGTAGGLLLALVTPFGLLFPLGYTVTLLGVSITQAVKHRDIALLATGLAAGVMHLSWGVGFIRALMDGFVGLRRKSLVRISA
ncbi:glycosyltransferase family 2 protein [Microvirga terrae]|uniref:Glycosyltransferase family 2 protein n=1 Tax=Microvirga terrae TaxID=2740529 RepID=A0ABY5RRK3_9HYPH|nr:glycosyltransferase family 2 protein [Microvirga terrae]UVF18412.1 glycosyltransferase family 2 protein [Microvirga terrae]